MASPASSLMLAPDQADSVALLPRSPTVAFDKSLDDILKLGSYDLTFQDSSLLVIGTF